MSQRGQDMEVSDLRCAHGIRLAVFTEFDVCSYSGVGLQIEAVTANWTLPHLVPDPQKRHAETIAAEVMKTKRRRIEAKPADTDTDVVAAASAVADTQEQKYKSELEPMVPVTTLGVTRSPCTNCVNAVDEVRFCSYPTVRPCSEP